MKRKLASPKIFLVVIAIILGLMPISLVFAIAVPDSDIVLELAQGYTGVLEDDDLLIVVKYDIPYASVPTEQVSDAFIARFLRSTTDLNSTELFPFDGKGYNEGVFSFYWTASQRSTDSVEHGNANSELYIIQLEGKAGVFPGGVPSQNTTTIIWQSRSALKQDVIDLALELEQATEWAVNSRDLITTGDLTQLTGAGAEYFATVIARLASMEPSLFESAVKALVPVTRVPINSYKEDLDDFWAGTFVATNTNRIAETNGMSPIVVRSVIALIIMVIITFATALTLRAADIPTANEFGLMTMAVTAPLAGAVNFLALEVVFVTALLGVTGVGWAIWGRRGG